MLIEKEDEIFNIAFAKIMKIEGGYIKHPNDLGGETKFGISKRLYPDLDIKNLTEYNAKYIYYKDYWLANKCETLHSLVAIKFFDFVVNMGGNQATKLLQRAIRACGIDIIEDGFLGGKTIEASNKYKFQEAIVSALKSEAAGFYRLLAFKNPNMMVFLKGWLNRAYKD